MDNNTVLGLYVAGPFAAGIVSLLVYKSVIGIKQFILYLKWKFKNE